MYCICRNLVNPLISDIHLLLLREISTTSSRLDIDGKCTFTVVECVAVHQLLTFGIRKQSCWSYQVVNYFLWCFDSRYSAVRGLNMNQSVVHAMIGNSNEWEKKWSRSRLRRTGHLYVFIYVCSRKQKFREKKRRGWLTWETAGLSYARPLRVPS